MNPDLPMQSTSLPHDIESLMTSVLGPNDSGTQRQEQEIQKIKNSLAADFEREKQTQKNYGAKQPMWQQQHPQQQHQLPHQQQQQQQHQQQQQQQQQQLGVHGHYNPPSWQSTSSTYAGQSMIQTRPPQAYPNATFTTSQAGRPAMHSLPAMVGQPQTSAQNLSSQATSSVPSTVVNEIVYRAPSIDSGMGTSNPSTPSTPSSTPTTATTSTISVQETKEPAGVWDLFEKKINAFTAESEDKAKQSG